MAQDATLKEYRAYRTLFEYSSCNDDYSMLNCCCLVIQCLSPYLTPIPNMKMLASPEDGSTTPSHHRLITPPTDQSDIRESLFQICYITAKQLSRPDVAALLMGCCNTHLNFTLTPTPTVKRTLTLRFLVGQRRCNIKTPFCNIAYFISIRISSSTSEKDYTIGTLHYN